MSSPTCATLTHQRTITAYVGLPVGKLDVTITNEDDNCGNPIVVVSSVKANSVMDGFLLDGDIITRLNGKEVPSEDQRFADILSQTHGDAADEFDKLLQDAGDVRYLMITRRINAFSQEAQENAQKKSSVRSTTVKILNNDYLGINVSSGNAAVAVLGVPIKMPLSRKRSVKPLVVSHVEESSQLKGLVGVGDAITHLNGHLLLGVEPGEFVEMLKDVGDGTRELTIQKMSA